MSDFAPLEVMVRRILAEQLGSGMLVGGMLSPGAAAGGSYVPPVGTLAQAPLLPVMPGAPAAWSEPSGPSLLASLSGPLAAEVALAQLAASPADSVCTFVVNSVTGWPTES